MATIYSGPAEIAIPKLDFSNIEAWKADEARYIDEMKKFCKERNSQQEHVGEIIRFPVADGYACYMVAAISPVQLIHLEIGDAWNFQYAKNLTKKDVLAEIKKEKAIKELFGRKK